VAGFFFLLEIRLRLEGRRATHDGSYQWPYPDEQVRAPGAAGVPGQFFQERMLVVGCVQEPGEARPTGGKGGGGGGGEKTGDGKRPGNRGLWRKDAALYAKADQGKKILTQARTKKKPACKSSVKRSGRMVITISCF